MNHLIIGLGGTGGNIIREMRKRIYEEFRGNEPAGRINIEYLYVDSSPADLNDRTKWKTMGGSVHLTEAQKISIHGIGASVLNNRQAYPGIRSFITEEDHALLDDIGALITAGIGGQRRRLGRILFANNLSGDMQQRFTTRLISAVQRLQNQNHSVTFHVCAGLAGGTGSGSIIDAVAQIRKEFAPQPGVGDQYKVMLYLYVPEMIVANPEHDSGYYQANGYAALSELNALCVNVYKPFDASGMSRNRDGSVKRLLEGCDAFEAAYLFSNINEAGRKLELGTELPAAVSDFLFQKIIVADMLPNGKMSRLVGCENNGAGPERDGAGAPVLGRRFISFGVKRVEYPETEVSEYVTYSFARQAARQLQYNLWRDGIGFDECSINEVGTGFKAEIQDRGTHEELLLADSYLTLSNPIIKNPAANRWREIASGWEAWTQAFAEDAQGTKEKKDWLSDFSNSCELQYNTNYRGLGVNEFYRVQRSEKKTYATYIRRRIEEKLFDEWRSGLKSTLEIMKYTSLLISDCEERIPKFNEKIAQYETSLKETNNEIKRCNNEWNNIGWLRDAATNVSSKKFSAYKTAKCEFYTMQTRIAGCRYARELLQEVMNELEQMQKGVTAFHANLTEMLDRINEQVEAKCKPETGEANGDAKIVKKYDPMQVRETTKRFTTDEDKQKGNAAAIRGQLVRVLGEDGRKSFAKLNEELDINTMEDIFIKECLKNATATMDDLSKADPMQRMLNVNIIEKIKQEYNSDEKLEEFVRNIVQSARCYLQINNEEIGQGTGTTMMRMLQVCLPEYNDPTNFRDKLIDMFGRIDPGLRPDEDVATNYKTNQIVVVTAASGFPLRFVANVATLKNRYDDMLIKPEADLNKMVLHTESFRKPLPELFVKPAGAEEIIPVAILAYAMGLALDKTDPTTGETFKAIGFVNELGKLGGWINLGKNVMQAVGKLGANEADMAKISRLVEQKLNTDYLHNDRKVELKTKIAELLNTQVLALCGNNDLDARFVKFSDAAIDIIRTQLAEK